MRIRHRILFVVTNIYWLLNYLVLIALTILSYNPSMICLKEDNGILLGFADYVINDIRNIQLCDDKLNWLGILTALWIAGLTIIVFILGKTNEIIYGIKFSNVIIWQITLLGVSGAGSIYAVLFLWGLWAYFYGIDACIVVDIFLIFTWIIGASSFVIYYSKKTNTFKAIRYNTITRAKKICHTPIGFDIDYYGLVNQLPLMKMIRYLESNDSEETQRVKECLLDICSLFEEEKITYQYFILMPIISAYCDKSGFKTRYEAAGTEGFFSDLLRHHWDKERCLWIRACIILPILEKWRGSDTGIDTIYILNYFPWSDRQRLVLIMLLYIEYLRCCGDECDEYIMALKRADLLQVVHEFAMDQNEKNILYKFWVSWNLFDHQEDFRFDVFYDFVEGFNNFGNEEYAHRTWVLGRLTWEEWRK